MKDRECLYCKQIFDCEGREKKGTCPRIQIAKGMESRYERYKNEQEAGREFSQMTMDEVK